MSKNKIEWAEHVWNPVTGCTRVGEGCTNCYAERQAKRFGRVGMLPQGTLIPSGIHPERWNDFSQILFHPDRLDKPLQRKKPTHYFVCSMGDLFHHHVRLSWTFEVLKVIAKCPQHTFTVLTKRPEWMRGFFKSIDYGNPLPNLRLYVSVWDQPSADEFIPILLDTPAAVRGVCVEPMLGPVDLRPFKLVAKRWGMIPEGIHHVILGGETGPGARPMHPDWARSVRDQCQAAGVPFFFKQWGEWVPCNTTFEGLKHHEWNCGYIGAPKPRYSLRVGKKAAGNTLDGCTWEELPR